jgi:hypothetical protein
MDFQPGKIRGIQMVGKLETMPLSTIHLINSGNQHNTKITYAISIISSYVIHNLWIRHDLYIYVMFHNLYIILYIFIYIYIIYISYISYIHHHLLSHQSHHPGPSGRPDHPGAFGPGSKHGQAPTPWSVPAPCWRARHGLRSPWPPGGVVPERRGLWKRENKKKNLGKSMGNPW